MLSHAGDEGEFSTVVWSCAKEDSPVFNYVSSLSPIKPVNAVHAIPVFGETNVPSPTPVFTSPRVNLPQKANFLQRSQNSGFSDAEKFSLGYIGSDKVLSENADIFLPSVSQSIVAVIPSSWKESDKEISAQVQPCSPQGCVSEFLAYPMEECVNSSGSDCSLNQAAEEPQVSQGECTSICETRKECYRKGSAQSQPCSSSVCVNKYKANSDEIAKCTDSPDMFSEQGSELSPDLQIVCVNTEKSTAKLELCNDSVEKVTRTKVAECLTSSYQVEEDPIGKETSVRVYPVRTQGSVKMNEKTKENNVKSLNECPRSIPEDANFFTKANLSILPCSGTQLNQNLLDQTAMGDPSIVSKENGRETMNHGKGKPTDPSDHCLHGIRDVKLHHDESGQMGESDCLHQLHPESFHNVHADNSYHENLGAISNTSVENRPSLERGEVCQHQHGMRKRLQFEAGDTCQMSTGCNAELPGRPKDLDILNASNETSSNKQLTQPAKFSGHALSRLLFRPRRIPEIHINKVDRSSKNNGNSLMAAPRPSGIGLHLNSIGKAATMNWNVNLQLTEKDCFVAQSEKLSGRNHQVSEDLNSCLASMIYTNDLSSKSTVSSDSPLAYPDAENSGDNQQQSQTLILANSLSLPNVNPLNRSLQSKLVDHYIAPCDMTKLPSENASRSEELNEMSPRKKRKKALENEGCKRCNCKRSKCLKLYCDCFAAGVYCAEPCMCQGCFNRPEYEDTVLGTRQQIELRNPLAFAPKVVLHGTESPKTIGDSKHVTPASARHKRGCNCKKSQCMKKYCECYQAGVGCSFGCRCEGCKNTFGKKGGCVEYTEVGHKKAKVENDPSDGTESVEARREKLNYEQCLSDICPPTPLLDGLNNESDVAESQFPIIIYRPSSLDSGASFPSSYRRSPRSPRTSVCNTRFAKAREGSSTLFSYDQKVDSHSGGKCDLRSPRCDRFADIRHLSSWQNPSPSTGFQAESDTRELINSLRTQLFQGSGHPSVGSMRWCSSPVTPMPQFGKNKSALDTDSDSGLPNVPEDDTPEILKDTDSPIRSVKTSSPHKKRVSPPHKCLHGMASNSSPSLRSGRKFILQSVPSFPSLTPYSNNNRGHGT